MNARRQPWQWRESEVDVSEDHFELRYGSGDHQGWAEWLPVALVGRPIEGVFPVQFLIECTDDSLQAIENHVKRELDFYLVELLANRNAVGSPWDYAIYHCSTMANAYSVVHWSYFPKLRRDPP